MIIQIGPFPPPFGGISIYIKRMKSFLDSKKIKNEVWNTFSDKEDEGVKKIKLKFIFKHILSASDAEILHYNISGIVGKKYIYMMNKTVGRNKKNIMTLHGDCKDLYVGNEKIMTRVLNSFNALICVKQGDKELLINKGVNVPIYEISAYIRPEYDIKDELDLPDRVKEFINNSEYLIAANGAININKEEDLYGLDLLIDLVKRISKVDSRVRLIFCLLAKNTQSDKEKQHYEKMKNEININNLNEKILIYEVENTEFYPILRKSNVFIRPTNTDGDAVSIREAIDLNIPCIASDVVKRPNECILFENRNIEDLYNKVCKVIENKNFYNTNMHNEMEKDNSIKVLQIYEDLLKI